MKPIKVAISQRIIPHYRVPVFTELSKRTEIDLTVFYGHGMKTGSQANAQRIGGFHSVKLATICLNYKGVYGSSQLRVWHPLLFFHLICGRFDVVIAEPSTNFYNDIFIYLYCKLFGKKFIWYESGSVPKNQRSRFRKIIDPFISTFIKGADAYITYTSYADRSLKRDFNIDNARIFRAQNTVDTTNIAKELEYYKPLVEAKKKELGMNECNVSLYIGGIEKRKKIENLITATCNLRADGMNTKCLIVGDGPDKEWLLQKMSDIEKQHTFFVGKQIKDATLYIMISDVVVLPSSGGLSVIQAFACKKPFIGSEEIEHGGIRDYVIPGENGYLVKENDINELQAALKKVFSEKELYETLCNNAYKTSKKMNIISMVDGIEKAIKYSVMGKK